MPRPRPTAAFRRDNDLVIHKLIPHASAYAVALNDGDPVACEEKIEAIAALLLAELKMPGRGGRPVAVPEVVADNVTPLARG